MSLRRDYKGIILHEMIESDKVDYTEERELPIGPKSFLV